MHTYCCRLNDEGRRFISGAQRMASEIPAFSAETEEPENVEDNEEE